MEQAAAESYSEQVKSAKADGRTLTPALNGSKWVKMGICRDRVQNGYKWVKMDISHVPHNQHHDHPGNP